MKTKSRVTNRDKEIGAALRKARKARRFSQAALGAKIDVAFQQVQKYERGQNRISASRLEQAADALNIPILYFYGLQEDSPLPLAHNTGIAAGELGNTP